MVIIIWVIKDKFKVQNFKEELISRIIDSSELVQLSPHSSSPCNNFRCFLRSRVEVVRIRRIMEEVVVVVVVVVVALLDRMRGSAKARSETTTS